MVSMRGLRWRDLALSAWMDSERCESTDSIGINHILAAFPQSLQERGRPQLELVEMQLGQVVNESGAMRSHVYFPTTAVVSLLYVLENGASAEIALVGHEGIVGVRSSWAVAPQPVVPWFKAPATRFDSKNRR
jgi:hypothetical protein